MTGNLRLRVRDWPCSRRECQDARSRAADARVQRRAAQRTRLGVRVQVGRRARDRLRRATGLRLLSRNDRDVTRAYPELEQLTRLLAGRRAVLDGEIVALDAKGRPSFSALQHRMHVRAPSAALVAATPVRLYLFDLLHLDGRDLTSLPYAERRDGPAGAGAQRAEHRHAAALDRRRRPGPGRRGGGPRPRRGRGQAAPLAVRTGRRSPAWVKVPLNDTIEVIVGGYKPGAGRRAGTIGSLLLGMYDAARPADLHRTRRHGLHPDRPARPAATPEAAEPARLTVRLPGAARTRPPRRLGPSRSWSATSPSAPGPPTAGCATPPGRGCAATASPPRSGCGRDRPPRCRPGGVRAGSPPAPSAARTPSATGRRSPRTPSL